MLSTKSLHCGDSDCTEPKNLTSRGINKHTKMGEGAIAVVHVEVAQGTSCVTLSRAWRLG